MAGHLVILRLFGDTTSLSRRRYRVFVEKGIAKGKKQALLLNARAHLCECLIDPHHVHMEVGFYAMDSAFDDYHAQYASMPAGRYGKVIILADEPQCYMRVHTHYDEPPEEVMWMDTVTSVTNQEKDGFFHVRAISSFRGIHQHHWAAYTRFFPNTSGIS